MKRQPPPASSTSGNAPGPVIPASLDSKIRGIQKGQKRYFGTDGIRGKAGRFPITPEFMLKLAWAFGRILARQAAGAQDTAGGRASVVIGKDTRVSGYMFESALEAGFVAAGADVKLLGPMPTPAVAFLTRAERASAGIVISASHNPFDDNGIKFFDAEGRKLPDAAELAIEEEMERELEAADSAALGKVARLEDAAERYIAHCRAAVPGDFNLRGLKLVLDCAHGAAYHIAPQVFRQLGAETIVIGAQPDGFNINAGVGATNMQALCAAVKAEGAALGIALDGDADRVQFADAAGEVVDGDELLFIIACHQGAPGVAGTLMSNLGMELGLRERGIAFARAPVGDRYVLEMMREKGWPLGGESSGHIINARLSTTGDGIVAALQVLQALQESGEPLAALKTRMRKFPQRMINVRVGKDAAAAAHPDILEAVAQTEAQLGKHGRVLLRPSGTEPVIRVMVEGEDAPQVERLCEELAKRVESVLAAG